MKIFRRSALSVLLVALVPLIAACGSSNSSSSSSSSSSGSGSGSKTPIVIGTSLSRSGDFSADGQAFQKG